MKKLLIFCALALVLCVVSGCAPPAPPIEEATTVDATRHGLSPENTGEQNSATLQALIDTLAQTGGTVYIPAGEYLFAAAGSQTIGSHCIKMRSDVSIIGDGEATVLKPVGVSAYGLDMFYFNEYLDSGEPVYLENCRFADFVIDAADTRCEQYTSAGKGFMLNLVKNCHWEGVTVKSTDATGFGVDCPIDSSMIRCTAIGCGKAGTTDSPGASGFGIGFGYCETECISISDCRADGNKKFGFFLEHQGRFDSEKYPAAAVGLFAVNDCTAADNLYGFGGICAMNTAYERCTAQNSSQYGFLFEDAAACRAVDCGSRGAKDASFAIIQSGTRQACRDVVFLRCRGEDAPLGALIDSNTDAAMMQGCRIEDCLFTDAEYTVHTDGSIHSLTLIGNVSDTDQNRLLAQIAVWEHADNSWN